MRANGEGIVFNAALNYCNVLTACAVILELLLQPFLRLNTLCKNDQARRFAIEAVNDENFFGRPFAVCLRAKKSIKRSSSFAFGRDGK